MNKDNFERINERLNDVNNNSLILHNKLKKIELTDIETDIYNFGFLKGYILGLQDSGLDVKMSVDGAFYLKVNER